MATHQLRTLIAHLRRCVVPVGGDVSSDAQLLERWNNERDEAAFELLLWRHGPMVLAVCRRLLRDSHDIEDAFQASFLILVRKGKSIRRPQALAAWLHRVAYRIALRLRAQQTERARREHSDVESIAIIERDELLSRELGTGLDDEINALPEGCRQAFILCCLQGKTHTEAARQLGRPTGTVSCWLKRGRERLRTRLLRRGLAPAAVLFGSAESEAQTDLPSSLVDAAREAARATTSAARGAESTLSLRVSTLVEESLLGVSVRKLSLGMALVLVAAGAVVLGRSAATQETEPEREAIAPASPQPQAQQEIAGRTDRYGDPLPPGAIARLGTARLRHDHLSGLSIAISPDGKVFASGGRSSLRLWRMSTGQMLWEIKEPYQEGPVRFAPDGKYLATWTGRRLCLLDPANGRLSRRIEAEGSLVALSPDGKRAVLSSAEGAISVWDTTTARRVYLLRGHTQALTGAAFMNNGATLLTICHGKKICRWDMTTGELRQAMDLNLPPYKSCRLSPDGRTLAIAPADREAVRLYDTATGEQCGALAGDRAKAGGGLTFSPDSRILATVSSEPWAESETVSLWDAASGKPLRHFSVPAGAAANLNFAPDGRTLLLTGADPQARLWDSATGRQLLTWPAHDGWVRNLAFTPDGRRLVSCDDQTVRVWELESSTQQHVLPRKGLGRLAFALLPDGRSLLSGARLGLDLRDLSDGGTVRRLMLDEHPEKLPKPEFMLPGHHIQNIGVSADGKLAACVSSVAIEAAPRMFRNAYEVHVWDVATGRLLAHRELEQAYYPLGFAPGLAALICWSSTLPPPTEKRTRDESGTYRFVFQDVRTGRHLLTLPQPDHGFTQYAVSPDGRTLVTTTALRTKDGRDFGPRTIRVWELASGKERLSIQCREAGYLFRHEWFAFAPDGRTLAAAREDRTLQVWDAVTGKELLRRTGCPGPVSSLTFSPDGKILATGLRDSSILLWDLPSPSRPPSDLGVKELEQLWSALASDDARAAWTAVWKLSEAPQRVLPLLRQRLRPAAPPSADEVRRLLADLDSSEFDKREAATARLRELGDRVLPALANALKAAPSPEKRRRIEDLLPTSDVVGSPELLRQVRSVEVLEHIGTAEARQVLKTLAEGMPEARLTREAAASLQRGR